MGWRMGGGQALICDTLFCFGIGVLWMWVDRRKREVHIDGDCSHLRRVLEVDGTFGIQWWRWGVLINGLLCPVSRRRDDSLSE